MKPLADIACHNVSSAYFVGSDWSQELDHIQCNVRHNRIWQGFWLEAIPPASRPKTRDTRRLTLSSPCSCSPEPPGRG